MSFDFGRNADDEIGMNPLRTIRVPLPQITRTSQGSFEIFDCVIGTSDIAYRVSSWHGAANIESGNLGGEKKF